MARRTRKTIRRRRSLSGLLDMKDWRQVSDDQCDAAARNTSEGSLDAYICLLPRHRVKRGAADYEWTVFDAGDRNARGVARSLGKGKAYSFPEAVQKVSKAAAKRRR